MAKLNIPPINHVFVLMLENHSFDNLLGFSDIKGIDAVNGNQTELNGLKGDESNIYQGVNYTVTILHKISCLSTLVMNFWIPYGN